MKNYGFFKSLLDQEHKNYSNCYNQPYYKIFFTICWRSTLKLRPRQTWIKCQGHWQCYENRAPPDPQRTAGSKAPDSAPSEHSALDLCFAGMPALFSTSIILAKLGMGSSLPIYNLLLLACLFFKLLIFLHLLMFTGVFCFLSNHNVLDLLWTLRNEKSIHHKNMYFSLVWLKKLFPNVHITQTHTKNKILDHNIHWRQLVIWNMIWLYFTDSDIMFQKILMNTIIYRQQKLQIFFCNLHITDILIILFKFFYKC